MPNYDVCNPIIIGLSYVATEGGNFFEACNIAGNN
ncbi:MAG: hypothetical protein H6Q72_3107 [Firmicutes bacterium]|nr:hypothetical protein [Bacillota bacterium]